MSGRGSKLQRLRGPAGPVLRVEQDGVEVRRPLRLRRGGDQLQLLSPGKQDFLTVFIACVVF